MTLTLQIRRRDDEDSSDALHLAHLALTQAGFSLHAEPRVYCYETNSAGRFVSEDVVYERAPKGGA